MPRSQQPQERGEQGDRDGADPGEHRVAGRVARSRARAAALGTTSPGRGAREPDRARERGGEGHGGRCYGRRVGCHDRTHDRHRRPACSCSRRRPSAGSTTRRRGWPPSCAGADVVAAEDTRRLRRLATDLGIEIPGRVVSYFEGNEHIRTESLLESLLGGRPGGAGHRRRDAERLRPRLPPGRGGHRARRHRDQRARPLGGADRAGGLRAAGRPVLLRGVPAAQGGGARPPAGAPWPRSSARWCSSRRRTAPHATLQAMAEVLGAERRGAVCRELTKTHEEVRRGTLAELVELGRAGRARRGDHRRRGRGRARGGHRPGDPGGAGRRGRGRRRRRARRRSSTWPAAPACPSGSSTTRCTARDRRAADRPDLPEPLPHPVVDNHCHLDIARGDDEPALPVDEALDAGGLGRRHPDRADRLRPRRVPRWAVETAEAHEQVVAGVALHPNEAPRLAAEGRLDEALAEIERLARQQRPGARGGGDRARLLPHRRGRPGGAARVVPRAHRAGQGARQDPGDPRPRRPRGRRTPDRRGGRPRALGDALLLRRRRRSPARAWTAGAYLSFAGTVTFKNAEPLREALRVAPLDRILVETDAPYLTPMPHRGRTERLLPGAAHRALDGGDPRDRT